MIIPSRIQISAGMTDSATLKESYSKIERIPASRWKTFKEESDSPLDRSISSARDFLFKEQLPSGYWWAELESNVTITSEYLFLFHFLGITDHSRDKKIATYLLDKQNSDGSWSIYYGAKGDISTTVEAYFALKMSGLSPSAPEMKKARGFVLQLGGIPKCRVFTKIFLALFGEYPWFGIPSMPIEMIHFPRWFYFNVYSFSSWSRGTIIPLSVVMATRPVKKIPESCRVKELYSRPPKPTDYTFNKDNGLISWKNFFIGIDHLLKIYERLPIRPGKNSATNKAETWILQHQEPAGDWGGIQPATLNSILALHCLGYSNDHPAVINGLRALEDFCLEDETSLRLQSCISPAWDTALALKALSSSGVPTNHPSAVKAAQWLIDREVRLKGDWAVTAPELEPGGWAFEFRNEFYPDVDDSAFVMLAVKDIETEDPLRKENAITRGIKWCSGMQSSNGGWGAFDRDNTRELLNKIPFADLEALIDPPTADLTGRMLELLGTFGTSKDDIRVLNALSFIKSTQEPEGPWWGRWGVNYIYGTWSVLCGLEAIGEDMNSEWVSKSVNWLESVQNEDGGWGESAASYSDRTLMGKGESTPSQTGWALLSLMAAGRVENESVKRGINYLQSRQLPDGSWEEREYTGTGFPKYFMIKYHIYRICFPLTALGTYRSKIKSIIS